MIDFLDKNEIAKEYQRELCIRRIAKNHYVGHAIIARLLDKAGVVRKHGNQGHCKGITYAKR